MCKSAIKRGMALAFFASAYADQADEADQPLSGEIMDQLPAFIDPAAEHAADTLTMDMERANACTLDDLYERCVEMDDQGADRDITDPEMFGHYCAMQAMGHGVGLESFGYAVRDAVIVPYCEFGSYSLQRDYFANEDDV